MDIVITPPNSRQREFFLAKEKYVAYGGARGGGKSWAVQRKATLLAVRYPGIRILIVRKTYADLFENHVLPMRLLCGRAAKYKESDHSMVFRNGSRISFGYLDSERDFDRYQGREYDVIFIDEATQFTELQFKVMTATCRGVNDYPKRIYLTCNPGGVGHGWVKRLFVDRDFLQGERPEEYKPLIKALAQDNKALMEKDPDYIHNLEALPEHLRAAWLDGDWDALSGRYFTEFRRDTHLYDPKPLPEHWRRYVSIDYGLDMFAALWFAVDEQGRAWCYREYCAPDLIITSAADMLRQKCEGERVETIYAPPDLWNRRQDTGRSVAETFATAGMPLAKASNNRVAGWLDVREWLKVQDGAPMLRISRDCAQLIKGLEELQHDKRDPSDVADEPHEITHAPDALRYFIAGRPMATQPKGIKDEFEPPEYEEQIYSVFGSGW